MKQLKTFIPAFLLFIFFLVSFVIHTPLATAQETVETSEVQTTPLPNQTVILDLYYGEGCPHCRDAKTFLESIKETYPNVEVRTFEVYHNLDNQLKMQEEAARLSTEARGVPFMVIGDTFISGFQSEETTGAYIISLIENQPTTHNQGTETVKENVDENKKSQETTQPSIEVPFIGEVTSDSFSLPVFTTLIAVIDGFNPCAMWTLLFLISLLLGMKDKKRMWLLGTVFIVTSAAVYFLFLSAWLSFFSFFGYLRWLQLAIGALALGSGAYYLKDFLTNKEGACKVTGSERRQHVFAQLKAFTQKNNWL